MANSADPDETAHHKPSNLDLHCLQRYLYWYTGKKSDVQHEITLLSTSLGKSVFACFFT